jgi:two-component system response regulator
MRGSNHLSRRARQRNNPRISRSGPTGGVVVGKPLMSRSVLLVEDNPDDEALTLRALRKNNFLNKITVARDGAEALEHLFSGDSSDARPPGLILLDLNLPKVDGLEVLRRTQADERTQMIPVVVLTSSKLEEDILASYRGGANAYVRKPVKFSEFAEAVSTLGMFWLLLNEPVPEFKQIRIEE